MDGGLNIERFHWIFTQSTSGNDVPAAQLIGRNLTETDIAGFVYTRFWGSRLGESWTRGGCFYRCWRRTVASVPRQARSSVIIHDHAFGGVFYDWIGWELSIGRQFSQYSCIARHPKRRNVSGTSCPALEHPQLGLLQLPRDIVMARACLGQDFTWRLMEARDRRRQKRRRSWQEQSTLSWPSTINDTSRTFKDRFIDTQCTYGSDRTPLHIWRNDLRLCLNVSHISSLFAPFNSSHTFFVFGFFYTKYRKFAD